MAFLPRLGFSFVLILAMAASSLLPNPLYAQTAQSSWIKSAPPTITNLSADIPQDLFSTPRNKDCLPRTKFITRHKNILKKYTETSHLACAVQTAFGFHSSYNGYIQMNNSNLAGRARSSNNGALTTVAIPQSRHIIYMGTGLYGSSRYIVKDFAKNSYPVIQSDSTLEHRLKPGVTGEPIKDSQGTIMELRDMDFSNNGKWAIADVPFRGTVRINIETGETLMFGRYFDYSIGLNPDLTYAISGDGRYALISEPKYNVLKIYDLDNCQSTTDPVKKSCPEKNLLPFIKSQVAGYSEVWRAEFSTNYTIRVYIRKKDQNNHYSYDYQLWTAAGHKETGLEYLALGDSFTSGEGTYHYKSGTDVEKPFNKCHLSPLSYPYLLAGRTGLNSVESVACSGAKMKDIFTADEGHYNHHLKQSGGKEADQFNGEIYSQFLVGYRTQASFTAKNKPSIVTLSISGNDIGFGKVLFSCLMPGTCYKDEQERLDLAYTINSKFSELVSTFQKIKNDAATNARIYIIGYPSLATPDGNCGLNVHLDRDEIIFSNQIINHLNNTIHRAAEKTGVHYVNVEDAFNGKRLCETNSSDIAVNGLSSGDDKTFSINLELLNTSLDVYLTGRESYHPNQIGHQLYTEAILKTTDGFKHDNPDPYLESQAPALENPHNLTPHKIEFQNDLSRDFLLLDRSAPLNVAGLQPSSYITVSVGTTPISTAVGRADQNGLLTSTFELPEDIGPGAHTLHVRGQNPSGEPIDIQKAVYITADLTDIDGDSVPNNQERCLLVSESSIDADLDKIDDACDDQIHRVSSETTAQHSKTHFEPPTFYRTSQENNTKPPPVINMKNPSDSISFMEKVSPFIQSNLQELSTIIGGGNTKKLSMTRLVGILGLLLLIGLLAWRWFIRR